MVKLTTCEGKKMLMVFEVLFVGIWSGLLESSSLSGWCPAHRSLGTENSQASASATWSGHRHRCGSAATADCADCRPHERSPDHGTALLRECTAPSNHRGTPSVPA